jgi:hypothetical protein
MSDFVPYIYVEHSLRRPTSVTVAAFTGAPWRFIGIPKSILLRDDEAQCGWVSWCVRKHCRENHCECLLFGSIIGYRWQRSHETCVLLDPRGRMIQTKSESFIPPSGFITLANKTVSIIRGTWQVTPTARV